MKMVKKVRDRALEDSDRIYMTISIDERKDKKVTIDSKMQAVEAAVGRRLCRS